MDEARFSELLESVREAGAYLRGEVDLSGPLDLEADQGEEDEKDSSTESLTL